MHSDYGALYARLYREHWWWRARESILLETIRGLRPRPGPAILDVGCGDAVSFPALAAFGDVRGIEVDEGLLDPDGPYRHRIATRPLGDPLYDDPAWQFDLITALDVLEHIEDDRAAVAAMVHMLRPGGRLVITVPAFELLWDHHDVINQHYRRYTAARLRRALDGQGLELLQMRYLFRGLFFPKLLVRALNAARRRKVDQHTVPAAPLNAAMCRLCVLEDRLLRRLPLGFGTSLLAVARRPGSAGGGPEPRSLAASGSSDS